MQATTAIYAPADSPAVKRLVKRKKRCGWRVLILDPNFWRGDLENVKTVYVESLDSPIAKAYEQHFERQHEQALIHLTASLGRKPRAKELEWIERGVIKTHKFKPAEKPPVTLSLDAEDAAREEQNRILANGFPLNKADKARVSAARAKKNKTRKLM